ncbi:PREDICTED: cold and drought-regulated protein CORA-like [Vollenhovia emeryi]|uniref:cold and drought-regulated protein CORA-like n=1 Tax=Vollenhovia emeryi TaxID=411798 RepID=UPI0005F41E46|nr:PREDICTED: cold and drought-regulated protein CORA-like [Vollenhovia emeryi]
MFLGKQPVSLPELAQLYIGLSERLTVTSSAREKALSRLSSRVARVSREWHETIEHGVVAWKYGGWFLVGIGRSKDVEHGDASYNGGGGQAAGHGGDLHGDGLHEGGLHAGGLHGGRLHGARRWVRPEVDAMATGCELAGHGTQAQQ